MAVSKDFRDMVMEGLEPLGYISAKRMFGGVGLYINDFIVAIIIDDQLFFKTDDLTRPEFETAGQKPFTYEKKNGSVGVMSYFSAPEGVYDDPDEMLKWAQLALETSIRADKMKKN